MSACHSLRSQSPLKTVFGKIGDTYQAYCNTYKTHTMATHHGGSGQPLDRDISVAREAHKTADIDIEDTQDFHTIDTDHFEDLEHNNPARLTAITRELDDFFRWVQAGEGQPLDALNHIEQELQRLSLLLNPPAPTEPLGEVLKHYMNTLCSAQIQTNLTNSLLQDISVFNGHDTTQLEDWLVDIETAANLTAKSRIKLAHAKSKGLTCTLITEAITSGKSWDDIKDLLQLKICNSDIHTSVSHFMEIQRKEKESLTVYIHHFKREAKRCNFTNNAATIRIFVKGLKNTHSLAAWIYEKGPQTLTDAISEAEKLQVAQQLTATLIPSSTVNVMSHEEDGCFQCQESGHIACHCPNAWCFECDEYEHIVVDFPHRIPPSGTPACHHRSQSQHRHHNRSTSYHHHEDRYKHSRSRSQLHHQRYCSQSCHNSYRGHSRSYHRNNRRHHRSNSQCPHSNTYIHYSHNDTPHRRSSSHRSSSPYSWDCSRSCSWSAYGPAKKTSHQNSSHFRRSQGNVDTKRNSKVTIDDP